MQGVQHDVTALFYDGYDQIGLLRPSHHRISRMAVAIGLAGVALLVFVAADVSALSSLPARVTVTQVNWFVLGTLIGSSQGFSLYSSQSTELSETCTLFCYNVSGVSVAPPFALVKSTIENLPVQWINLTVKAPAAAYDGNLSITLEVP